MKNIKLKILQLLSLIIVLSPIFVHESLGASTTPRISIKATAKSERDKKNYDEKEWGQWSYQSTEEEETIALLVTIRNKGKESVTGKLNWFFVSDHFLENPSLANFRTGNLFASASIAVKKRNLQETKGMIIFSTGEKSITLAGGEKRETTIISDIFTYRNTACTFVNEHAPSSLTDDRDIQEGDLYEGYALLFTVDGKVIASTAKKSRHLKSEWIEKWEQTKSDTNEDPTSSIERCRRLALQAKSDASNSEN